MRDEEAQMPAERQANQLGKRGEAWVAGQIAILAAIALAPRRLPGLPEWPAWLAWPSRIAGLLLGAAGALLAIAGALALGSNLTPFPRPRENAALVEDGVYRVARHPIYTGIVIGALGWSLLRRSILAVLLTVALALFFDRKARREETWLVEKFPEYESYRARVRRRIL